MMKIKCEYICIAPSKELFNVSGESLGMSGKRALYYSTRIGRHRIYRSQYPIEPYYFNGVDINKQLKLLKYKSIKYAQKVCDLINNAYGDDFKPVVIER